MTWRRELAHSTKSNLRLYPRLSWHKKHYGLSQRTLERHFRIRWEAYGGNPIICRFCWERLWLTSSAKSFCFQIDVQNYAKTIVLLVRVSTCKSEISSRGCCSSQVLHGRGLYLHASPKTRRFRRIQVLCKDFSEVLLLLYQVLSKDSVQQTIKTLVKYGIPEAKIPHVHSTFLCKCGVPMLCKKKSAIAHPWSVIKKGINIPSDSSSSNLRFSMTFAVAGAASRFVPFFANEIISSNSISS